MGRWLQTCLVCQLVLPWHLNTAAASNSTFFFYGADGEATAVKPEVRITPWRVILLLTNMYEEPLELHCVAQCIEVCRPVMELQERVLGRGSHFRRCTQPTSQAASKVGWSSAQTAEVASLSMTTWAAQV